MNTETEEVRRLMLAVAHNAIDSRAEIEGYEAGEYDAKEDPEGYIVSVINGLQQWCLANNTDWDEGLQRAETFFLQDVGVPETPATIEDLKCPVCGHEGSFYVEVTEVLLRFTDGTVLPDDTPDRWGDMSYCSCHECAHAGRVYQFRKDFLAEEEKSYG